MKFKFNILAAEKKNKTLVAPNKTAMVCKLAQIPAEI
jgi:hypothetical protein